MMDRSDELMTTDRQHVSDRVWVLGAGAVSAILGFAALIAFPVRGSSLVATTIILSVITLLVLLGAADTAFRRRTRAAADRNR